RLGAGLVRLGPEVGPGLLELRLQIRLPGLRPVQLRLQLRPKLLARVELQLVLGQRGVQPVVREGEGYRDYREDYARRADAEGRSRGPELLRLVRGLGRESCVSWGNLG